MQHAFRSHCFRSKQRAGPGLGSRFVGTLCSRWCRRAIVATNQKPVRPTLSSASPSQGAGPRTRRFCCRSTQVDFPSLQTPRLKQVNVSPSKNSALQHPHRPRHSTTANCCECPGSLYYALTRPPRTPSTLSLALPPLDRRSTHLRARRLLPGPPATLRAR